MSSLEPAIDQLMPDTEALLRHLGELAQLTDGTRLQEGLVTTAAQLAQCPLSYLFVLDNTGTGLNLAAAWCDGQVQAQAADSQPRNYMNEALLQYCLNQHQALNIPLLSNGLYQTDFLPAGEPGWRCLLCIPLHDVSQGLRGLLLVADRHARDLNSSSASLCHLGHFVLVQLGRLRHLHPAPAMAPKHASISDRPASNYGLLGNSPCMQGVRELISKVLDYPVSVLVTGETGTGKELVARAIHDNGARASKSFVAQNCASLPENLLESELFGYVRGAFTGADSHRPGLFDAANGGTLFLDEIGDMQLALQGKLLRVLQEGEVRPLGSNKTHKVDVRIIAATHHNLEELVEAGQFRRDLFYRLAYFPIELPPLRERGADVRALAEHFTATFCTTLQRPTCHWSSEALALLDSESFPGNVRQLRAQVERAVLLCDSGELLPCHLDPRQAKQEVKPPTNLQQRLDQLERGLLLDCLRRNGGNQSQSARELQVSRRTFLNRLARLDIKPAEQDFRPVKKPTKPHFHDPMHRSKGISG
nr:sigma 54-interacting transcriptional regulator [Pseudomonas fluorescens]